jgi:rod shape-determining protein MreD
MRPLLVLGIILAVLFETTAGPRLSPVGGRPMFLLSVVVYFAWMRGTVPGTLFGLGLGLLADLMSLNPPGLRMFSMCLVGAVVGNITGSIYKDRAVVQWLVLSFAVWLNETSVFLIGTGVDLAAYPAWFLRQIVPSAVWTALLCPLAIMMWEHLTGREVSFDAERVVVRR